MAIEDQLYDELVDVLKRINDLPRPVMRRKMLWKALHAIAAVLGVSVVSGDQ